MAATRDKRSFATIRKLPSGRYQVRYTGPDGIRRPAPNTFAARIDAEAYVVAKRRDIDRKVWDATDDDRPDPVTFGAYAAGWLDGRQVAGRPIKARTREHYTKILDDHLLPTFGNRQVSSIKPKDVRDWYTATLADRPTLRSHAYSLLRTIMGSAVTDELLDANPCRITGAGRSKRVHKIRPASIDELATVTAAMPERLQLMVMLASWCALRFGETVELRRGDIDLSAEVIRIRRAAVRTQGEYAVTTPKSDAGVRDVAIPPHIIPQIETHLSKYVGGKHDSLIFANESGGHLQPSTLYRHWYKARGAAGRKDLRWHDLRHSGAVLAAATGASLAELMARLGHSTPQAAMRYQHAAQGRDRQIAALLSKIAENGGMP
ncbi:MULTISPECIES: tyrosine-type recombinase/integrase [Mycobacterium]|uniref:Prophage phiRv2 integrase n=1 Tax=Mycobacterium kiyosense TaxID=2871094 RepID=A0A9P3UWQ0_9MYCO|nr:MULTISPECIES: site-specific integrase [Mycobacterium]BDB43324.1 putative prophage phiRv2 integrase [Mycobacterium kiyosense]BDE13505.1 putative prophage phiRv2 integrase [Mycobacterium sp. 20KCMC460]GLB84157.1 putative prophage phiRv2 integrase [Mycobacterium kiyosense]GLB88438.1 putative prophage phiRv2 integrase [Mycobacterium kiyosense]GLB94637.1 putative prophage phiRv2 integrase [Mycobacterium kiyosense]